MAKKASAKETTPASQIRDLRSTLRPFARPSALLDTRVVYCGDCFEKLRKLPDACETAMRRSKREKGIFVAFDYSEDAMRKIHRFFTQDRAIIIPMTVPEIPDEQIARKLA